MYFGGVVEPIKKIVQRKGVMKFIMRVSQRKWKLCVGLLVWITCYLISQTGTAMTVTGFGGASIQETIEGTAGVAVNVALFTLLEGEFGGVWTEESVLPYANFNIRLPAFVLFPAWELERRYWWIFPYFEGGIGMFDNDAALNAGIGANVFMRVRLDYRYFVVPEHENRHRVYLGLEIPLAWFW